MPRYDPRADPARRAQWGAAFDDVIAHDPEGRTPRMFVAACGWSPSQAPRFHAGQIPHPDHVRRIAAVARRDPALLLAAAGYQAEAQAAAAAPASASGRLQHVLDRIPATKRDAFVQTVERIADLTL